MNLFMMLLGVAIVIGVSLIPGEQFVIALAGGAMFGMGVGSWFYDRKMR